MFIQPNLQSQPYDHIQVILSFLFEEDAWNLRQCTKYLFKHVQFKHVSGLMINERNKYLLNHDLRHIQKLDCSHNQLTSLPKIPNIEQLRCYNNQLTSLPEMPNIRVLYCECNHLTSLPEMPNIQKLKQ